MIPCPIAENAMATIPKDTLQTMFGLTHFIVERARTARRYFKQAGHPTPIDEMSILELDKHEGNTDISSFLSVTDRGISIGVLSEAGCPGVADPGAHIVALAHQLHIDVSPCVGPSSILLALMASGMNGQSFTFNGYLPNKKPTLVSRLRQLESRVHQQQEAQIFMDAPYRNEFLLNTCIETLRPQTRLCVAVDIGLPSQEIYTLPISKWEKANFKKYHKRPAIVIIGE